MADTYEKDLGAKSAITSSDYIRVVGSDNVSYKQPMSFFPTKAEVNALNSKFTGTTLLSWGSYTDGTYTLSSAIERFGLLYIAVGASGAYNFIVPCGQAGDRIKHYTEDGWLTIEFPTTTSVTISGTGANSRVREMRIFKDFKLSL